MASSAQVLVGTTPTLITRGPGAARGEVLIKNSGGSSIFLGGPGVTTATGYEMPTAGSPQRVPVGAGDALYGIVAAGTVRCDVLIPSA